MISTTTHLPLITLIGAVSMISILLRFLWFIVCLCRATLRKSNDLGSRYGKKSWAFITASSDGIGKGFAIAFAKRGFNIILSARNLEKLKQTERQLKQINKDIQTKILVVDFKDGDNISFYNKIFDEIKHLDISILVNNMGITSINLFNLSESELLRYVNANMRCIALFTRKFITLFQQRKHKCAIINLSSLIKNIPISIGNIYGSTKKFDDFLSRALTFEYPQFDILSYSPGMVSTPSTLNMETDLFVTSPQRSVECLLNDLGYEISSSGPWCHKLQQFLTDSLGQRLAVYLSKFTPKKLQDVIDYHNKTK